MTIRSIGYKWSCAILLVALFVAAPAKASVVGSFSVTPGITTNDPASLSLSLALNADSGYFNPQFTGGTVNFNNGDGTTNAFVIAATGANPSPELFSYNHVYSSAGNYSPSYSFSASYSEQYQSYDYLYYTTYQYQSGTYSY